ncbi:MAG: protein translocase subunit SecF [Polyangiaceae bacterium]
MQLFPSHKLYDFMGARFWAILASLVMTLGALVLIVTPGPRLGTDFKGGTEIEVGFHKKVSGADVRAALGAAGFHQADVVGVADPKLPSRYLIRVEAVSTLSQAQRHLIESRMCFGKGEGCTAERESTEVKFSQGGDKITVRFRETPDVAWVKERMAGLSGIELREGATNPFVQNAREHKVEIQLKSKGDQLMDALKAKLVPGSIEEDSLLRVEWIGPKAGAQLRDSALKAIAISVIFIMTYIAFRFDIRFAPGAVVAMIHDAVSAIGLLIIMGREINLSTVAAILTIVGYSVNDTVIVYDRVRENLGRLRGATFVGLINVSISEMLGRTILASGTTVFSLLSFFFFGTGALKDFALTLVMGVVMGTYSSIYVALPFTEWLDRKYFGGKGAIAAKGTYKKKAEAVV